MKANNLLLGIVILTLIVLCIPVQVYKKYGYECLVSPCPEYEKMSLAAYVIMELSSDKDEYSLNKFTY